MIYNQGGSIPMGLLLLMLSAIGLALLIVCIIKLVSPFVGWNCIYETSIQQMAANIPKPGRYAINIRRDRFWLWKGQGTLSDAFPKVNFSVQLKNTGAAIPYFPGRSLMTSNSSSSRMTVFVGHFDAPVSGEYVITSLPESNFFENEEILIRKHLPFIKFFLLIWGIVIGALIFLSCLIFGILFLSDVFTMSSSIPALIAGMITIK